MSKNAWICQENPAKYDNLKIQGCNDLDFIAGLYQDFIELTPSYKNLFGEVMINDLNKIIVNVSDDKVYPFVSMCLKSKNKSELSIEQINFLITNEEEGFLDIIYFLNEKKIDIRTKKNVNPIIEELCKDEKLFKDLLEFETNRADLKKSSSILFGNLNDKNFVGNLELKIKDLNYPIKSIYQTSSYIIKPIASSLQRIFYR